MNLLCTALHLNSLPLALLQLRERTMWMPPQHATQAPAVDDLFYFIYWVSMFFLVGITLVLIWFAWRYRYTAQRQSADPSPHHNFALEVSWSIIPLFLVIGIFWVGYKGYLDLITPPPHSYEILVTGRQWNWEFTYPNGLVWHELHAPANTDVLLTMQSDDVLHALFIPDFRIKQDVVPGRYTKLWFNAPNPGEHDLFCAEYCGNEHSTMITFCVIHDADDFTRWLNEKQDELMDLPPVELGELIFRTRGCAQCHTTTGISSTGPSLLGVYGHEVLLEDGTSIIADENYIRESILDPGAKIVRGYANVMPTFSGKLSDREITGVIEFIKSLTE